MTRPPYAGWELDDLPPRPLPPAQPQGWVDPDPLDVQMQVVYPERRHEPLMLGGSDRRDARGCALFGLGVCAGILLSFAVFFLAPVLDGPTPQPPLERPVPAQGGTGAPVPARGSPLAEISAGAPSASPVPTGEVGTALIGGWATYYATCSDCAAAGPLLQAALGPNWKGQTIRVVSELGQVDVRLVTSCACGDRTKNGVTKPTIIDLSLEAFGELSPAPAGSATDPGFIAVSIEIGDPGVTLPPTDLPRHPDDDRMREEVRGDELYR